MSATSALRFVTEHLDDLIKQHRLELRIRTGGAVNIYHSKRNEKFRNLCSHQKLIQP